MWAGVFLELVTADIAVYLKLSIDRGVYPLSYSGHNRDESSVLICCKNWVEIQFANFR